MSIFLKETFPLQQQEDSILYLPRRLQSVQREGCK
jgi:hypothetical protein